MWGALMILAVIGFAALVWQFAQAGFAVVRRILEAFVAREYATLRAREGDLTGLAEAERRAATARGARWGAIGRLVLWGGLLAAPVFTPWMLEIYAACSLLWLVHARTAPTHPASGPQRPSSVEE